MNADARAEDLLRELAQQVLGALIRCCGHFQARNRREVTPAVHAEARSACRRAALRAASPPERRCLKARADRLPSEDP